MKVQSPGFLLVSKRRIIKVVLGEKSAVFVKWRSHRLLLGCKANLNLGIRGTVAQLLMHVIGNGEGAKSFVRKKSVYQPGPIAFFYRESFHNSD